MAQEQSMYQLMGIDPHKTSVKDIFKKIISNDFPGAFVNIVRIQGRPGWVRTKHSDGSGSKSVQRCLDYFERGKEKVFRHDVVDAAVMNFGDASSCGFVCYYDLTQMIAINAFTVPKETILRQNALGLLDLIALYAFYGIKINLFGGETADLPDQTNSYILDMDVYSEAREKDIIKGNVESGDVIFGLASDGQAVWEKEWNYGGMSNGYTMFRKGLMSKDYNRKYPFLHFPKKGYFGRFRVGDLDDIDDVSQAILSPTRHWPIVIKLLIERLKACKAFHLLHGITMNTGGGATKILNLGQEIHYRKKMPSDWPALFKLIQRETSETEKNMFTTFNTGIGLDIVGSPKGGELWRAVRLVSAQTKIKCWKLGDCLRSRTGANHLTLKSGENKYEYP